MSEIGLAYGQRELLWDHPFSTYAAFSGKLTFLIP